MVIAENTMERRALEAEATAERLAVECAAAATKIADLEARLAERVTCPGAQAVEQLAEMRERLQAEREEHGATRRLLGLARAEAAEWGRKVGDLEARLDAAQAEDLPECPGPDCPGCWDNSDPDCEHDAIDRHEGAQAPTVEGNSSRNSKSSPGEPEEISLLRDAAPTGEHDRWDRFDTIGNIGADALNAAPEVLRLYDEARAQVEERERWLDEIAEAASEATEPEGDGETTAQRVRRVIRERDEARALVAKLTAALDERNTEVAKLTADLAAEGAEGEALTAERDEIARGYHALKTQMKAIADADAAREQVIAEVQAETMRPWRADPLSAEDRADLDDLRALGGQVVEAWDASDREKMIEAVALLRELVDAEEPAPPLEVFEPRAPRPLPPVSAGDHVVRYVLAMAPTPEPVRARCACLAAGRERCAVHGSEPVVHAVTSVIDSEVT